ncbi:MAG: 50S ribosomal protein L3 N(5)-glutamine methyltransferase [Pseudomonadales bacterium]|nr:50S ribosomal protein L3 N(5)-glutamine methyltransferase [Pseudomonadales bacterium]MCP5190946.1 50S ribosomal protein L3 N(5)-glutamine methyltransferase [Pseudomonadales bacterium]
MSDDATTTNRPATIGQALDYCSARLQDSAACFGHGTDNPWDEAVQLVLAVADLPLDADDGVLPHPLDAAAWARIESLLEQRIEDHVPLPYLLGRAWFAGLQFACDPRAIIPRSPIAELVLNDFQPWYSGPPLRRVLDLCCGGGCIGLAVAHYYPDVEVDLVDIDAAALQLARENAAALGLASRVNIIESDLFAALAGRRYDLIISNPPYVDREDLAALPAEYLHEPALALGSGSDGLDLTRRLLAAAADHLEETGLLVVEVGNSWPALEQAYPKVAFTWLEFEHGGHGVFALSARELQDYDASWRG